MPPKPITATVKPDGTLDVPFAPGTVVTVAEVAAKRPAAPPGARPDLRADLSNYEPFEPVALPEDWEALQ